MKKTVKNPQRIDAKTKKSFPDTLITVATVITDDQDILAAYLKEVSQVVQKHFTYYEILVVDNGSQDGSHLVMQHIQKQVPNIRLLLLSRRYDQEIAFAAALENSIGDYVLLLDIAYDPPALIPKLIKVAHGGFDIVIAERMDRNENTWLERTLAKIYYWFMSKLLGFPFAPNASNYRVFSRRVVQAITKIRSKNRYLRYYNATIGFTQTYVPYHRIYRRRVNRRKALFSSIHFALNVIFAHSLFPLRFVSALGLFFGILNLLVALGIDILFVIHGQSIGQIGFLTLTDASLFFFVFLIFAVLVEYIGRILNESKEQPLYFVVDEHNSAIITAETDQVNVV